MAEYLHCIFLFMDIAFSGMQILVTWFGRAAAGHTQLAKLMI